MDYEEQLRTLQARFFSTIRDKYFGDEKLALQVADITDVTRSTAYKKMRCESPLSSRDYMLLAQHFGISLDALILPAETDFLVRRQNYIRSERDLITYLTRTAEELRRLSSVPHDFYYAARDLPVFLFFQNETLMRFKIALWLSELSDNDKEFKNYYHIISRELAEACKVFSDSYHTLKRFEIWSPDTMKNLANQINYYEELGLLSANEASEIRRSVVELLDYVCNEMKQHEGDANSSWSIYEVDYLLMSNNGLVITPKKTVAYISYSGINYLRVEQYDFCKDLEVSFLKQKANATSLVASRKSRVLFFQKLKACFDI